MIDELDREIHAALGAILDLAPNVTGPPMADRTTRRGGLFRVAAGVLVVTAIAAVIWVSTRPSSRLAIGATSTLATPGPTSSTATTDTVATSTSPNTSPTGDLAAPWDPRQLVRDTPERIRLAQLGVEAAIRTCMANAGFDYRMQAVSAPVLPPDIPDDTYRRQYGFGMPPQAPPDTAWDAWITTALKNPAFARALDGCTPTAYRTIYPPDGAAVSPLNATLNKRMNEFIVAVYGDADHRFSGGILDPTLESARADWSSCMKSHGIDAVSPGGLAAEMRSARPSHRDDIGVTQAEIDAALADWQCEVSTDYLHRWYGHLEALTAQFAEANAATIAQIKAWQGQVAVRAQQAVDSAP